MVDIYTEIKINDFNLNIPRYVDTFEEEVVIDKDAVQKENEQLASQLAVVCTRLRSIFPSRKNG